LIHDVLIVGGGHGGAQAAIALRHAGFAGSIAIAGSEPEAPYDRPPLSKEYLSGAKPFSRLLLRPLEFWIQKNVALLPGRTVISVDPAARQVTCESGETLHYGKLVWATGGIPRKLGCPGAQLAGVQTVRNKADIDAIIAQLPQVTQVTVIGGGYIGLEAAAVLSKLGKQVTIIELADRLLARVAGAELAGYYAAVHRAQGVDVRTECHVSAILGEERVTAVQLADGQQIPAQLVIVGIGILPVVAPLQAAGAAGDNGVRVDQQCRTTLPDVFAIGDCAAHASRFAGGRVVRIESVQNANDMASVAAKTLCGMAVEYTATPWFWSNQYDVKLQSVGLSTGYQQAVVRGDPARHSFSVLYLLDSKVIAIDCVNNARDYAHGRRLIEQGVKVDAGAIANAAWPLRDWLSPAASVET
jgi:3-phenylpropionate/trans-cinnamate dioxygenase ferredoxin reductase component